jgi:NAD-reducing hydrogenase large subunit
MRLENYREEIRTFANFPTLFMALVNDRGCLEFSEGKIRVVNEAGKKVREDTIPADYQTLIGEAVEPWTYMKFPYYKPDGYPNGCYRVGPLARMNVIDRCGTPEADQEWVEFQDLERGVPLSSFYYHYARLIEMIFILERLKMILTDPDITSEHVRAFAKPNNFEGIGVAEAPRGTLIHHYHIDENGLITNANLIIATGQNNLAMNRGILQAAKHFVRAGQFTEGALNRVEAVIRAFDPCLSCSTHALGQMPLLIQLVDADGKIQDEVRRET